MQELEHVQPAGFIIATSNLPRQLDEAVWRRFDLAIEFPRPDARERAKFVATRATALGISATSGLVAQARRVSSYADAEKVVV